MPLTPKQKAFADLYLECGNATEAAKRAGYKEKAAYATGAENLRKPQIISYMAERQKQIEDSRIADISEVLQFFSAVMRGGVKDQFGLDASLSDRLNAGKELMKRHAAAENVNTGTQTPEDDALTKALREEAKNLANQ